MDLFEFIGHLHPVLVHLPIGILLVAILFEWLSHRKSFRKLRKSVRLLLLLGFVSSFFTSCTGYLLSLSGDYDDQLLARHQWLGIIVTVVSLIAALLSRIKQKELRVAYGMIIFSLAILILLTGHAGGSLTHGTDFLKPPPLSDWFGVTRDNQYLKADLKSALFYKDLIAPLFNEKCIRCHGPSRQKGKLRLDKPEYILKGGKDGPVIQSSGKDAESEIIRRIELDLIDEDHMPPREKSQLNKEEIDLISYWVAAGANFEKQFIAMPGADSMMTLLASHSVAAGANDPVPEVDMPDPKAIENLRAGGVAVSFLARENGLVSLNFINADTSHVATLLDVVLSIRQQTWELKLVGSKLSHRDWGRISNLPILHRLNLENSNVTDPDLRSLRTLPNLRFLNLAGTSITISGLKDLSPLPTLKNIFLYRTGVRASEFEEAKRLFPEVVIDTGNYFVPTLSSDTSELTKPYVVPGK